MSERPFISSALGGRPTMPYPNATTAYIYINMVKYEYYRVQGVFNPKFN